MSALERITRVLNRDRTAWAQPEESAVIGVPEAELRQLLSAASALEQARLAIEEAAYGNHVGALNEAHAIIVAALAAATGTAKTRNGAECGASQSGDAKAAQRPKDVQ